MEVCFMKKSSPWLVGACLLLAVGGSALAQAPPKILVVQREFTKPGKGGAMHDKSESAFAQEFTKVKMPVTYLGMNSLSGKARVLFMSFYESFDAWEKEVDAINKNETLSAALDLLNVADGELLESSDQSVYTRRDDYSFNPKANNPHRRALEVLVFHVKPGHYKEWDDLMKLVLATYAKGIPAAHWACFESMFGAPSGTYVFLTAIDHASDIDASMMDDKKFVETLGPDGLTKLGELEAASVESSEQQLFVYNPRLSHPSEEFLKADPDFWNPKPMAAKAPAKRKEAAAPAQ
jgi:hypothetical protein